MAKQDITNREKGGKQEKLPQEGYNNPRVSKIRVLMMDLNNSRHAFQEICKDIQERGNTLDEKIKEDYDGHVKLCIRECANLIAYIEYDSVVNNLWPDFREVIAKLEKRHNHE